MSIVATAQSTATAANESGGGGLYFAFQSLVLVIGFVIHVLVDRHDDAKTKPRVVELALLWTVAGVGTWAILGGIAHIGPTSDTLAVEIGYTQSMFQWEVGWADIAIGVLGLGAIWKRDGWLDAAVTALAIGYGGDAIGHIMEYVAHDNAAGSNVWAIPSDIIQPLLAIVLLIAYRRQSRDRVAAVAG